PREELRRVPLELGERARGRGVELVAFDAAAQLPAHAGGGAPAVVFEKQPAALIVGAEHQPVGVAAEQVEAEAYVPVVLGEEDVELVRLLRVDELKALDHR